MSDIESNRYLGWFTAVSDDVDEPQKQAAEEVNERTTEDCHKECWGQKSRSLLKHRLIGTATPERTEYDHYRPPTTNLQVKRRNQQSDA